MKIDRLRGLAIGCIAIAAMAIAFEIFTRASSGSNIHPFAMMLLILGVALEKIRLELRDLREELLTKIAEQRANDR
jgi:hypothetical protein